MGNQDMKRIIALLLLPLAGCALPAVQRATQDLGSPATQVVRPGVPWVAVGDSILYSTAKPMREHITPGGNTYVQLAASLYNAGWGTASIADTVHQHVDEIGQGGRLIIQDDGSYTDYASMSRFVAEVNGYTPTDVKIIWVLPFSPFARDRDAVIAQAIVEGAGQHLSAIADWPAVNASDPDLLADVVHPNDRGDEVWANMIVGVW